MPLDRRDVMALLAQLADEDNMRVTVRGSAWGGVVTGLSAFLGGVALGPPGLLLGGTLGGGASYAMSQGKFQSAAAVIQSMPPQQQEQLASSVTHLVRRIRADDAVMAAAMLAAGMTDVRALLLTQVAQFLTSEMAMQVMSG